MIIYIPNLGTKEEEDEKPMYYQNFDLDNIHTPVDPVILSRLLREAKYPDDKITRLQEGFTRGFDIGYIGPQQRQSHSANILLTVGNKIQLWNKLMKEVQLERVAGPFEEIPYKNFIQSPIGLVPKAGNKTRLIFHLSYSFDKGDKLGSLNQHTPRHLCKVVYRNLDYAVQAYLRLVNQISGSSAVAHTDQTDDRNVYSDAGHRTSIKGGKTDVQNAFRLIPLLKKCWKWLVMMAQDPQNGKWRYFIDKCLPFGASISCALFQEFSDALCFLAEYRTQSPGCITNYLDDFLFLAITLWRCNYMIRSFLNLCKEIGVPIAIEKTEWGTEMIIFLGILLDGKHLRLSIPLEIRNKAIQILQLLLSKKKATVKELQSLCGYLNFLCKAIFPGCPFLGGLSLHLNHLYSIVHDNLRLAIWDTSFWTFLVRFGYKGP